MIGVRKGSRLGGLDSNESSLNGRFAPNNTLVKEDMRR